jgi:hypothetical protein
MLPSAVPTPVQISSSQDRDDPCHHSPFHDSSYDSSAMSSELAGIPAPIWLWPDSLDALIAARAHHTLLLENERVRVHTYAHLARSSRAGTHSPLAGGGIHLDLEPLRTPRRPSCYTPACCDRPTSQSGVEAERLPDWSRSSTPSRGLSILTVSVLDTRVLTYP